MMDPIEEANKRAREELKSSHSGEGLSFFANKDSFKKMFSKQEEFMRLLEERDILPPWPVDLTTKQGQRMIKEIAHDMHNELWEATYTLKNKLHKLSDDREFDREHYKEELGDTFAFFMEICILSGIGAEEMIEEYYRKNNIVKERFENGY